MSTLLRLFEPSSASTASSTGTKASSSSSSKPLVLVVDEFDLFAAHPRQSFLYCLLDIVQGNRRSGGFAVVGVSARVDCLSLLEKRVRSRCQSHVLQVVPRSSFEGLCAMAARMLRADARAWELVRGEEGKKWAEAWNGEVEVRPSLSFSRARVLEARLTSTLPAALPQGEEGRRVLEPPLVDPRQRPDRAPLRSGASCSLFLRALASRPRS